MPELPDIEAYLAALNQRLAGERFESITITSPFVLRTVEPRPDALSGSVMKEVSRIGKRVVLHSSTGLSVVIHLMIAGRFRSSPERKKAPGKITLAVFHFTTGDLVLTEAGSRRRASIHVVPSAEVGTFDRGGIDLRRATVEQFAERLRSERHTLKRALTDHACSMGSATPIRMKSSTLRASHLCR
jgi:formamidopyrimidine-DNA glycosylase